MTHIDEAIRRALSPEDREAYDALSQDQNPVEAVLATFRTRHRAFAIFSWVLGFALSVVAAWAIWRFLEAVDVREMMRWGALAAFALFSLGLVKLWFWSEVQTNGLTREIKRLELQVASLIAGRS